MRSVGAMRLGFGEGHQGDSEPDDKGLESMLEARSIDQVELEALMEHVQSYVDLGHSMAYRLARSVTGRVQILIADASGSAYVLTA